MNTFLRRRTVRVLLHFLFWFLYLVISAATVKKFYLDESLLDIMIRYAVTLPVDILATYFTAYFLLPHFLYKMKYVWFTVIFLVTAVGFILLQRVAIWYITYPILLKEEPGSPFFLLNWLYNFTNIYIIVFAVSVIKLFQRNIRKEKNLQELNEKRTEAELKFLKAQVHPHFLFNTLNNLYALTLEQSSKAPEVVLKLSELLNYMLYECNEKTILVSKEIKLIENYLSLESIRYGDKMKLDFQVAGEIAGKKIAPMLLLPFVENAFKHGVSRIGGNAKVSIFLNIQNKELIFQVSNTQPESNKDDMAGYSEGIGLKNVQRRLDLMYPDQYTLTLQQTGPEFIIYLKLYF
ncbi:MAG: histidine kinase [Bacteroidota bacterium]|nr:histidine kinase [Bacteroidota bacterium]